MNANSLSVGNVIKYNNGFWIITKKDHVKPGKGGAFIQVELKNIMTGTKTNDRFRSDENIEKAFIEEKTFQYQYDEVDSIIVMNNETFEQEFFNKDLLDGKFPFLQEGMLLKVVYCEGNAIDIKLPETIISGIRETEPTTKGQTITSSFKPAILDNGVRVMVPQFVTADDKIIVRTEDSTYVERAK